jgi:CubicO group peptidase (beta-lactamase class C family)
MYQGEDTPIVSRVFGYSLIDGLWRRTDQSVTSATRGDGGVYASIMDLLHWNRALEPGHPNPLVSDAVLTRIVEPGLLDNGESCGYAYGWKIDRWRGLLRQGHTGSTIGFRTAIQRYPERRLMIALLTNRNDGTPWTLAEDIAGCVLGLDA